MDESKAFLLADAHGDNALHAAASQGALRALAQLAKPEVGFDLAAENERGLTALALAQECEQSAAAAFLADPTAAIAGGLSTVEEGAPAEAEAAGTAAAVNFTTKEGGHNWVKLFDAEHECEYWHCEETGESRWVDEPVAEDAEDAEVAETAAVAPAQTAEEAASSAAQAEATPLPEGWTKVESRSKPGKFFYHHTPTGTNCWKLKKVLNGKALR
jgi:hypothetical protein